MGFYYRPRGHGRGHATFPGEQGIVSCYDDDVALDGRPRYIANEVQRSKDY